MQGPPEELQTPQPEENVFFAGLLEDLLANWDAAPESEQAAVSEEEAEPAAAMPDLLSRLEMPRLDLSLFQLEPCTEAATPEQAESSEPCLPHAVVDEPAIEVAAEELIELELCIEAVAPEQAEFSEASLPQAVIDQPAAIEVAAEELIELEPCVEAVAPEQAEFSEERLPQAVIDEPAIELAAELQYEPDAEESVVESYLQPPLDLVAEMPAVEALEEVEPHVEPDGALASLLSSIEEEIREADPLPAPPAEPEPRPLDRYITFQVAGSAYALELKNVLEADRIPRTTNIPGVPVFLRGVTNLRGEILPLLDLRSLLDLQPADNPGTGRMLVVRTSKSGGACGLIVDRLGGMAFMDRGGLHPARSSAGDPSSQLISGIGEDRGRLVNVLDLERLFAVNKVRELTGE